MLPCVYASRSLSRRSLAPATRPPRRAVDSLPPGIDAVDLYPTWLYLPDDSPLHFLHIFRQNYIRDYNDPITQWTPDSGMNWVPLFLGFEFLVSFPIALYSIYRLSGRKGTTGPHELLLLVYAFEVAFPAAVCVHDVSYWDPNVYSPEQKDMFRYQLYGPWFAIRRLPLLS